jgi:Virulence factor
MLRPRVMTVFWRDIPLTVNAQSGRTRYSRNLPRRFRRAVDTAAKDLPSALIPGHGDWRVVARGCTPDLELEVTTEVARLDAEFGSDRLRRLASNHGRDSRLVPRSSSTS